MTPRAFALKIATATALLLFSSPIAKAEVVLSSAPVVLQTAHPGENAFAVLTGTTLTSGPTTITGDNSQDWVFTNRGTITATNTGTTSGLHLNSATINAAQVFNYGGITSAGTTASQAAGVDFDNGGRVYNYAGALISGAQDGVHTDGGSLLLENSGTIISTGASAVYSGQGAIVRNFAGGLIQGGTFGVRMNGPLDGLFVNAGTVTATQNAFFLNNALAVYTFHNTATGVIQSGDIALRLEGQTGQMVNEGLVESTGDSALHATGSVDVYVNAGTMRSGGGTVGVVLDGDNNRFYNLGRLESSGGGAAIQVNGNNSVVVLAQNVELLRLPYSVSGLGSDLVGGLLSTGTGNSVFLGDSGTEDDDFNGFETLSMRGTDWRLSNTVNLVGTTADSLNVQSGKLVLAGTLSTPGGATVYNGATLLVGDSPGSAAMLTLGATQPALVLAGGFFGGTGTLTGDLENQGNVILGTPSLDTPGVFTVQGNYHGAPGSALLGAARMYGDTPSASALHIDAGNASGVSRLFFRSLGGGGPSTSQRVPVVLPQNGATTGTDSFVLGRAVYAGISEYGLFRDPATQEWYLMNIGPHPEGGAYLANIVAAERLLEHSRLDRRNMSDVSGHQKAGWMHISGHDGEMNAGNDSIAVDTNDMRVQAGTNLFSGSILGGPDVFQAGLMAGYGRAWSTSRAHGNSRETDGRVDSWSLGAYATWLADGDAGLGAYADTWVQYAWQQNSVHGESLDEHSYNSRALALSLELGYALPLAGKSLVLTPQTQIVWMDYSMPEQNGPNSDIAIDDRDADGLRTRLALRLHGEIALPGGAALVPFAEVSLLHGENGVGVAFDDEVLRSDTPDNLTEVKAGLSGRLPGGIELWGRVEHRFGENGYRDTGGTLGLAYMW